MNIVENRLSEIFDYLPLMSYSVNGTEYKPKFGYGTQKHLNDFIINSAQNLVDIYPLIWLLYPYREEHTNKGRKVEVKELTLILAVNASKTMNTEERLTTTFNKVLFPLYDNVILSFFRANTVNMQDLIKVVKFPNYSGDNLSGEENFTVDRWDALKVIISICFNDACLTPIKI